MPDPPQQAGEQVERLRIVVCPVCRHAEEVATFNNGVVCHGFEKRGTAHARTFMRPYVPADQATQQLREAEERAGEMERDAIDADARAGEAILAREAAEKREAELRERVEGLEAENAGQAAHIEAAEREVTELRAEGSGA